MPYLEIPTELADQLADWIGVYGSCHSDGEKGCLFDEKGAVCCRQGFVSDISERMRQAVKNETQLAAQTSVCAEIEGAAGTGQNAAAELNGRTKPAISEK